MTAKDSNKWWVFVGGALMIFLVNVDMTIVNLALASIAKELQTNLTQIQWVINSYLLTTIIFFIIGGKLADTYSLKRIFLVGTLFFAVASLIAGLAPNFSTLIIARLIQGVGFAFTLGLALLMISNAFPANQRGFIMGISITITGLGLAVGPTLGGVILSEFNWHWIFLINVPLAVLSFIIISLFAEKTPSRRQKQSVDITGAILLGIAITSLLLTFNALAHTHFNFLYFVAGLILSMILFVAFYFKEIKTNNPLVNFHLFKRRDYALSIGVRFFFMYSYGTFLFFIPLYLQNILGYSPLTAGLMILVFSAIFGICSPMAGLWCDNAGYKPPIIFSTLACFLAFIIIALIGVKTPIYTVLFALAIFGVGAGISIPSTVNSTISSLPKESAGEGIGMFFTVAFMGVSLGVAISASQLNLVSSHHLFSMQQHLLVGLSNQTINLVQAVANGSQPITKLQHILGPGTYAAMIDATRFSFIKGFSSVMWLNAVLALITTIMGVAMKRNAKP